MALTFHCLFCSEVLAILWLYKKPVMVSLVHWVIQMLIVIKRYTNVMIMWHVSQTWCCTMDLNSLTICSLGCNACVHCSVLRNLRLRFPSEDTSSCSLLLHTCRQVYPPTFIWKCGKVRRVSALWPKAPNIWIGLGGAFLKIRVPLLLNYTPNPVKSFKKQNTKVFACRT